MFCRCFGLLGGVGLGMLSRHAFGDGLGDFFRVSADRAGPYFVYVLTFVWRLPVSFILEIVLATPGSSLDPWEHHFGDGFEDPWGHQLGYIETRFE